MKVAGWALLVMLVAGSGAAEEGWAPFVGAYRVAVQGAEPGEAELTPSGDPLAPLTLRLTLGERGPLYLRGQRDPQGRWSFRGRTRALAEHLVGASSSSRLTLVGSPTLLEGRLDGARRVILVRRTVGEVRAFGFGASDPTAREGLRSMIDPRGAEGEWHLGVPTTLERAGALMQLLTGKRVSEQRAWELGSLPYGAGKNTFRAYGGTGPQVTAVNCVDCHSGIVAGIHVAGLPTTHIDAAVGIAQADAALQQRDSLLLKVLTTRKERKVLGEFLDYYETILRPSSVFATVRGDNPGPYTIWRTLARLEGSPETGFRFAPKGKITDLERALFHVPGSDALRPLPTVQPNPWWILKYRKRAFWLNDVTHLTAPTFALNEIDALPEGPEAIRARMRERMARTETHLAFARQTTAPRYPGPIDDALADEGFRVFHSGAVSCASCHGQHRRDGTFLGEEIFESDTPDALRAKARLFPDAVYDVGTDPAYLNRIRSFGALYEVADDFFQGYPERYFSKVAFPVNRLDPLWGTVGDPLAGEGYYAPPLVGVWSTAPYFHNGAVPTLEHVLDPPSRPTIWQMNVDPYAYDDQRVGMSHRKLTPAELELAQRRAAGKPVTSRAATELRWIYDTRDRPMGRGNQGHPTVDGSWGLAGPENAERRRALLEYLKRL